MYYRGAAAALLCYDITSKSSFDKVVTWVEGKWLRVANNNEYFGRTASEYKVLNLALLTKFTFH